MALETNINNSGASSTENKGTTVAQAAAKAAEIEKEELEREYIDKRSVTISLVHNYSNYRRVNLKVLGQRREVIGSSIRSGQILSSNAGEVNKYFPELVGLSPNHPEFISRVKAWLSNIQFIISENDVSLNTSFVYNHKKDYLAIKKQEDAINAEYDKVDRADINAIKEALKKKIEDLNTLESSKYQYGHPQNLEQYLMYRHCLLYKEVAKDVALINSDSTLRFYIKDEVREQERQRKIVLERKTAMTNFVELSSSEKKFNAVYLAICINRNDNLSEALLKDANIKQSIVMNYVNDYPDKFNKLVNDKHIIIKAFIETLILRGELVRSDVNQQIMTPDGTYIGANMPEAISWFENPNNKAERTKYEQKLNLV